MARSVVVKLGSPFSQAAGRKELRLDLPESVRSVADVMQVLWQRYPVLADEMQPEQDGFAAYSVFMNDNQVRQTELASTPVPDGAEIRILMPMAGG